MSAKEWAIPVLVAAATFTLLWFVQPEASTAGHAADDGYTYVFPDAAVVRDANDSATVLLLSDLAQALDDDGRGVDWRSAHVGFQQTTTPILDFCEPFPCPPRHIVADAATPRLGLAGYNATKVTVHVFDEAGILVFSNAPQSERDRFDEGLGANDLPGGTWYIGANSTAPEGTQRLPPAAAAFFDRLRPLVIGLPEGGVATTQTNALVSLYGTLFATLRVDELVHAP